MSWDRLPPTIQTEPDAATVRRRMRGLQSKRAGEHFEGLIEASLNWYKEKGIAKIEKTPEPMRPLRAPNRQGQFLACYTKAAQPDFKGTLAGGRSVVFEAKYTDTDRIEYSRLTPEQLDDLNEHYQLGAVAFVLVCVDSEYFYRVPWTTWRDMKKLYNHKHMKLSELEPFQVPYIAGVIKLLDGIESSGLEAKPPAEAMELIESVLDSLVEVGNGITDEQLHGAADQLFKARDILEKK